MYTIKRIMAAFLSTILLASSFIMMPVSTYAETGAASANRMNVVFVMDESGSMNSTDKEKFRYEALEMFFGISSERGNYIGAVAFNDGIVLKEDLKEITGKEEKLAISDKIKGVGSAGDTNIGLALDTAVDMLTEKRNPDLDNVIIILSDGNTDLSEVIKDKTELEKAMAESEAKKQMAIDKAKTANITIHAVCLNSNGAADKNELQKVSDATGGTCVEVTNAQDLKDVFATFYELIYSIETIKLTDGQVGGDGSLEVPFDIPETGIDEANLIINGAGVQTVSLTSPSGAVIEGQDLSGMELSSRTFDILKLASPEAGSWKLVLKSKAGTNVSVDMIYNSDLEVSLSKKSDAAVRVGNPVSINCLIKDKGQEIKDASVYKESPVKLTIKNVATGDEQVVDMEPSDNGCVYTFTPETMDDFEMTALVEMDGLKKTSDTLTVSVGNTAPTAEDYSATKFILPGSKAAVIDLSSQAKDAEDSELVYTITGGSLQGDNVTLDGDKLTINYTKSGSGTVEIQAADTKGETVSFTVSIKCMNLTMVIIIVLLVLIIGGAITFFVRYSLMNGPKPIRGTIELIPFVDGEAQEGVTVEHYEAKKPISDYIKVYENIGVELSKAYINGSIQSNHVNFVSTNGKGYRTKFNPFAERTKIKLDDRRETFIYGGSGISCGICITYKSEKN